MKLNDKGFAVSSVLYSMLILFLAIVLVILMILASSKFTYNSVRNQILDDLNITTSSEVLTYKTGDLVFYNPVTREPCDYINSYDYLETGTCYSFYVITDSPVSESNVSLIMNRNLLPGSWDADGNVNWYSSNVNTVGPLTALNSLKDATVDWNIDDLNYNYENSGTSGSNGYNKILVADNSWGLFSNGNTTEVPNNTISDLKVRMLTLEEAATLGCTTSNSSCNTFLYENIGTSSYWLLTSNAASSSNVYIINNNGGYSSASVTTSYGIRPVIEVDKRGLLACNTNGVCASSNPSAPVLISSDPDIDEIVATYSESTDANGIRDYECYYGANANNLKSKGTVNGLTCTMSNLNPITTYYYMFCSVNSLDRTNCSKVSSTTTETPMALFSYTGAMQTYEIPVSGTYKVELWGASGNTWKTASNPGSGAYVSGQITLTAGSNLYVYVGSNATAFNGGSIGGDTSGTEVGGGATDVRITSGSWDDITSLRSRIIVAAAGGGTGEGSGKGGDAGGLTGNSGATSYSGSGASQTAGGAGGSNGTMSGITGTFGAGGNGGLETSWGYGGSGGSGYYGGGGGAGVAGVDGAGGSGSSFISGHTGAVAIVSSSSTNARTGTGGAACTTGTTDNLCSIHYSGKSFSNTLMIDGSGYAWTNTKGSLQQMPNPSGGYYSSGVGHTGTGYAKITFISA